MSQHEFTTEKFASLVGVEPRTVRDWCRRGLLDGLKRGGRWYFDFRDLIAGRAAKRLTDRGLTPTQVVSALESLLRRTSETDNPLVRLKLDGINGRLVLNEGAMRIDVADGQLHLNLSTPSTAQETGRLVDGVRAFREQKFTEDPETIESLSATAFAAETRQEWDSAAKAYRSILRSHPDDVSAIVNLGNCHYQLGDYAVSIEVYRAAIQVQSDCAEAWYNLGNVLDATQQFDAAVSAFQTAIALSPKRFEIHYNLALTFEKMGARSKARSHWRCVLELTDEEHATKMAKVFIECDGVNEP